MGGADAFSFELQQLGRLEKLAVWHEGREEGSAWMLDRVEVERGDEVGGFCEEGLAALTYHSSLSGTLPQLKHQVVTFPCGRWLEPPSPRAELRPAPPPPSAWYRFEVRTANCKGAGTDASVSVELLGSSGRSGVFHLDSPGAFERGKCDVFEVCGVGLGRQQLAKLRVVSDGRGQRARWCLGGVRVQVLDEPGGAALETVYFTANNRCVRAIPDHNPPPFLLPATIGCCPLAHNPHHIKHPNHARWLDDQCGLAAELLPGEETPPPKLATYTLNIRTADRRGAGTDAGIEINMEGEEAVASTGHHRQSGATSTRTTRQTGWCPLHASQDQLERGREDTFVVELADVGVPRRLGVRSDGAGASPGWCLEWVSLTLNTHGSGQQQPTRAAPCWWFVAGERWLDAKTGLEVWLEAQDGGPKSLEGSKAYTVTVHTSDIR